MRDSEQQELIIAFVEEGNEMLDESGPLLIELESKAQRSGHVDTETLNTIFRLFHSLKGGAGFLQLCTIQDIAHEAETLLDLFRKGRGDLNSSHIDLLTHTCDFLRSRLHIIASDLNDQSCTKEALAIIFKLRQKITEITSETPAVISIQPQDFDVAELYDARCERPEITTDVINRFVSESEGLLAAAEEAFAGLEKNPDNDDGVALAFQALHSLKGNAGFLGYCDLEQLSQKIASALQQVRDKEIRGNSALYSLFLDILDFFRDTIALAAAGKPPAIPSLPGLLSLITDTVANTEAGVKLIQKQSVQREGGVAFGVLKRVPPGTTQPVCDSNDFGRVPPGTTQPEHASYDGSRVPRDIAQPVRDSYDFGRVPLDTTQPEHASYDGSVEVPNYKISQGRSIRVDVAKLETLFDLVAELEIFEAMFAQRPNLQMPGSLDGFERASSQLNKITRDLQDVAIAIRMMPLSGTFSRMVRLVRDLSQKTAKKVHLKTSGENIELDRAVLEKITDPLIHIIRNAIDHGIGTAEERTACGKRQTGQLFLEARHGGSEVQIAVRDDGHGLDRQKILSRAVTCGLVDPDRDTLTDEEICQLVFHPGFSTADTVTKVSGRGVGMDVVRRNIESIGGRAEISSEEGKGTIVNLYIPVTLAIVDGMLVSFSDKNKGKGKGTERQNWQQCDNGDAGVDSDEFGELCH